MFYEKKGNRLPVMGGNKSAGVLSCAMDVIRCCDSDTLRLVKFVLGRQEEEPVLGRRVVS